jgi:uncharacterized protein (TIGR03382 family)
MRTLICVLAAVVPLSAWADQYPYVVKGPVISGVTQTEAWVAWETAHHEGTGVTCSADAFLGTPNTDIPTATLTPAGSSGTFTDSNCSRDHKVHLTGLSPGTKYALSLDKPWDATTPAAAQFTTAPAATDGVFSFVVYGDNRDGATVQSSTQADHKAVADAILASETDASFFVHTGDLALNITAVSGDDKGYTEFFDVERGLLSTRGIFTAIGNHETIDTTEFDLLVNAPGFAAQPHPYYWSMDWGQAHIAFLDSFEGASTSLGFGGNAPLITDAQAAWLDSDLAEAQAAGKLLFTVAHQGPFSHSNDSSAHGGSPDFQTKIVPLMLKYGVLANFGGHDHYYQRGHEGCVDYFVVGGGGAPMYEPDSTAMGVAVSRKVTSYLVVSVNGQQATATAKDTSGSVIDTFTFQVPDGTSCGVIAPGGMDAGTSMDGVDAGGQQSADAGSVESSDAGPVESFDGGPGNNGDAGSIASATSDSGQPSPGDAGSPGATAKGNGCGCQGAGAVGPAFGLAALALVRLRRKRSASLVN